MMLMDTPDLPLAAVSVAASHTMQRVASQELQVSEDDLEERLQQLTNLLPGQQKLL